MTFDWAAIITAASAFVACASLWSGFYLYRISQRDNVVRRTRSALVASRTLAKQLDRFLTYELGYEIINSVASSSQTKIPLHRIHSLFFSDHNNRKSKKELEKYLKTGMPYIIASVQSPMADSFELKFAQLEQERAILQFNHPGVARIVTAVSQVMFNTFIGQKELAHDEDTWRRAIIHLYDKKILDVVLEDYDAFQANLVETLLVAWIHMMNEVNQANINDTIAALNLVAERYLTKRPAEMVRIAKYETSKTMKPTDQVENVVHQLREAEKCLDKALSQEDMMLLRQYSSQMKTRSQGSKSTSS